MIALGEIPIPIKIGLETFGRATLESLLPLRIGNVNSKTGEDEKIKPLTLDVAERIIRFRRDK